MATFQELYQTLLAAQARSNLPEAIKYIRTQQDFDPKQLDCLLNPQKHPLVWRTGDAAARPARARANAPARSTRSIPRPKRAGGSPST